MTHNTYSSPVKRYSQRRQRYTSMSKRLIGCFPLGLQQSGSGPLGALRNFLANNNIPASKKITAMTAIMFSTVLPP
jgi:hypothetical protein